VFGLDWIIVFMRKGGWRKTVWIGFVRFIIRKVMFIIGDAWVKVEMEVGCNDGGKSGEWEGMPRLHCSGEVGYYLRCNVILFSA